MEQNLGRFTPRNDRRKMRTGPGLLRRAAEPVLTVQAYVIEWCLSNGPEIKPSFKTFPGHRFSSRRFGELPQLAWLLVQVTRSIRFQHHNIFQAHAPLALDINAGLDGKREAFLYLLLIALQVERILVRRQANA